VTGTGCSGASCGSVSLANTASGAPTVYTAPASIPSPAIVTLTATSVTDSTKLNSTDVTIIGLPVVDARPFIISVPVKATRQFIAGVVNDPTNQGVTWQLSGPGCTGAACGTLSVNHTEALGYTFYTAPATMPSPPTVVVTCTSVEVPSVSSSATVTITPSNNSQMKGQYAFLFNGFDQAGEMAIAGSFVADGAGNITSGTEDINRANFASSSTPVNFSGSYVIGIDNRGTMTLNGSKGTATFNFLLDPDGASAKFIEYDDIDGSGTRGSGSMLKQDATAFSLAKTQGDTVMQLLGNLPNVGRMGIVGRFTSTSTGTVSGSVLDSSLPGGSSSSVSWTGSFAAPDAASGRGTMSFTTTIPSPGPGALTLNLAYYIVSADRTFVLVTDPRGSVIPLLSGEMHRQSIPVGGFTTNSLNGKAIFATQGVVSGTGSIAVGLFRFAPGSPSEGQLSGNLDQNDGGVLTLNATFFGTYSVSPNGHATAGFVRGVTPGMSYALYLEDTNSGFLLEAAGDEVGLGVLLPQTAGTFDASSIAGTFRIATGPPVNPIYQNTNGPGSFDGVDAFAMTIDTSDTEQFLRTKGRSGTYSVDPSGRVVVNSASGFDFAMWMVSPDLMYCIDTVRPGDTNPGLLEFSRL
jgi:hypothetical protein